MVKNILILSAVDNQGKAGNKGSLPFLFSSARVSKPWPTGQIRQTVSLFTWAAASPVTLQRQGELCLPFEDLGGHTLPEPQNTEAKTPCGSKSSYMVSGLSELNYCFMEIRETFPGGRNHGTRSLVLLVLRTK